MDAADFETFLNVDNDFTPASATATPHPSVPQLAHQNSSISNLGASSQQQTFAGPSFQYDAYRQQTGLPVGGLANTFAVNQNSGLNHFDGQSSFVMPNEITNFPLTKLEDFDFARHPSFDMSDMDFEEDSPSDVPAMFFPGGSSNGFVSPTNLVASNASPSTSAPVPRMYPGMHSQQAAQKAQEAQQKQQELIRQQQQQQQQQRQVPGQKPLPKGQPAKDPAVEESISRILSQMRQKREADFDDDEGTPGPSSSGPRTKKEEDDMDEDERLLASEEGKKLSSKERRQLRNKVSARAFRSRRKEYIGQLEGDLATKAAEADGLRVENQQLREENNRLTDLTRMLLSSSAFSGFLQDLSQTGVPITQAQIPQATKQERTQAQPKRKDVNPHEAARRMQQSQKQQVGMVLMPENNLDMSLFDIPAWTPAVSSNDVSIYSVTSLPEGPALDLEKMSGKTRSSKVSSKVEKKELPTLPEIPEAVQKASAETIEVQDPVSSITGSVSEATRTSTTESIVTVNPKSCCALSLVSEQAEVNKTGSWERLQAMCNELENTSQHLKDLIPGVE